MSNYSRPQETLQEVALGVLRRAGVLVENLDAQTRREVLLGGLQNRQQIGEMLRRYDEHKSQEGE